MRRKPVPLPARSARLARTAPAENAERDGERSPALSISN